MESIMSDIKKQQQPKNPAQPNKDQPQRQEQKPQQQNNPNRKA